MILVDSLSQFASYIDISELKLPSGTMVYEEEEGKVHATNLSMCDPCFLGRLTSEQTLISKVVLISLGLLFATVEPLINRK